jgi:hypothetical protein
MKFSKLCFEIEMLGRSGDLAAAPEQMTHLVDEYQRVEKWLKRELNKRRTTPASSLRPAPASPQG